MASRQAVSQLPVLTLYNDGSFQRHAGTQIPACTHFVDGIASKDVVLNSSAGVWARIFLSQPVAHNKIRVPVVLYFHGGGFCINSPSAPDIHTFCARMAAASNCIWMSVNYRLAPENPLPAAYDDAYAVLLWLLSQASAQGDASGTETWLAQYADFSKCFLAGESSGGTIVHFLAARAARRNWSPLKIQGILLIHARFATENRDEEDSQRDPHLLQFFRRSMLPPGVQWSHPWLNPLHSDAPELAQMDLPPVFVAVAEKDGLREASMKYYEALKLAGKNAQLFESHGEGHCFHLRHGTGRPAAELLETRMIEFIGNLSKPAA